MKDFAIQPPQTLNRRHEKPVDGSIPNRSLDLTNPTFVEVHSVMTRVPGGGLAQLPANRAKR
jgi:hypothetical protein